MIRKLKVVKPVPNQYFSEEYAMCRTLQHEWMPSDIVNNQRNRLYHVTLRCARCTTLKMFLMRYDGIIIKRLGYRYPEGYLAGHRLSTQEKGALGLEVLKQMQEILHGKHEAKFSESPNKSS